MESAVIWQSKHTRSSSEFNVSRGNTLLYSCIVRYLSGSLKFEFTDSEKKELLSLRFPIKRKDGLLGNVSKNERDLHTLYAGSMSCGRISTVHLPFHDDYYKLVYNSDTYSADIIGYGKKGLKILIFDNEEKQVALVEHEVNSLEHLNRYSLTVVNDELLPLFALFVIYYDRFILNKPWKNHGKYSPVYCFSCARQKSLYDPDWLTAVELDSVINTAPEEVSAAEFTDETVEDEAVEEATVLSVEDESFDDAVTETDVEETGAENAAEEIDDEPETSDEYDVDTSDTIKFEIKEDEFAAYFDRLKDSSSIYSDEEEVAESDRPKPAFITDIPQDDEY